MIDLPSQSGTADEAGTRLPSEVAGLSQLQTQVSSPTNIITANNIHKTYQLGAVSVPALKGVTLNIAAGELLAICGPSGSGKSTLLNLIGLIDRPTEGEILLHGEPVQRYSANRLAELRNQFIGFIFQSFNLMPVLSAYENVLLPLQIAGRVNKAQQEKARALLAEVGLADQMHSWPDRMSGGQRQRVAIARALITDPQLVIADEPTANLDSRTSEKILALIEQLNVEYGVTFVFSTHDQRVINHVHRSVWLEDGQFATHSREKS